jgi:hypothetical protein
MRVRAPVPASMMWRYSELGDSERPVGFKPQLALHLRRGLAAAGRRSAARTVTVCGTPVREKGPAINAWRRGNRTRSEAPNSFPTVVMEKEESFGLFTMRGDQSMCDYSLHLVASRPAKIGDKLVTTSSRSSITRGFAAIGEPNVAVCLLPGTEIAFDNAVQCDRLIGINILPRKKIGQRLARFGQINMDVPTIHHDALEFPDGQVVLLTRLCAGQRATVLQLPATAHPAAAKEVRPDLRERSRLA